MCLCLCLRPRPRPWRCVVRGALCVVPGPSSIRCLLMDGVPGLNLEGWIQFVGKHGITAGAVRACAAPVYPRPARAVFL